MYSIRTQILAACFMAMVVSSAMAEAISFDASLDADKLPLGTAAQLTLTVRGTQDVTQVSLPAIDGFETRYVGPSTQILVVNGEYSTAKTFTFMLLPLKAGAFTIPAIAVDIKGQSYQSHPITVEVVAASAAAGAVSNTANSHTEDKDLAQLKKLLIIIPTKNCFMFEEVPISIKLYVRELPIQDISFPQITQDGFILSEFGRPRQYQEAVAGKTFEVVEFNARLTATREGAVSVGPALITGNLLIKNNVRRNPFGSNLLDDDFFTGFFNSYQKQPVTITSEAVSLTVQPLPGDERPGDFSGGVGRFNFEVTTSPLEVKVGDPVTIKMAIEGTGDLKTVKMPVLKDERFKVYDPQIKEANGRKVCEQVVVPLKEGRVEIPAINFSYFNTKEGKYLTLTRGPFEVNVLPLEKGQEFQAIGFTDKSPALLKENLGNDIVFIKDHSGRLLSKKGWLWRNGLLLTTFIMFLNIWGVLLGVFIYRRKLSMDPGFASRSTALRLARAALRDLQALIVEGGSRDFYTSLFKVFNDYMFKKINLSPGKMDHQAVEAELMVRQVDKRKLDYLKELYELAEKARFASATVSLADMKRSLFDVEEVIEEIERRVK